MILIWLLSFYLTHASRLTVNLTRTQSSSFISRPWMSLIRTPLSNKDNLQYYGSLSLGSQQKSFSFIYDTGSNWLWIPSTQCSNCRNNRYNTNSSTSFKTLSNTPVNITYGTGSVKGFRSQDQVWLSSSHKIDNMTLLSVTTEQGMEGIAADGIFGLCPLNSDLKSPPFILDYLKDSNLIQSRIISFALHQPYQQSVLIFGTPDYTQAHSNPARNFTVPLVDRGNYYQIELSHSNYGIVELSSSPQMAILDTGTSLLGMPSSTYNNLIGFIIQTYEYEIDSQGNVLTICDNLDIMDLEMFFGDHQTRIRFDKLWSADSDGICTLLPFEAQFWILGDIFLRHFYVVIDYDNSQVQIISSIKESTQDTYAEGLSVGWIVFIVIVCIIVAVAVGTALGVCCKKRQRDLEQQYGNPNTTEVTEHDDPFVAPVVQDRSPWASIEIER